MSIRLYTQPNCGFCDLMKEMLDKVKISYYTIDIKEDEMALAFIKEQGHRTVPQLYANDVHINTNPNTREYTPDELERLIIEATSREWPWVDSGIEQGI